MFFEVLVNLLGKNGVAINDVAINDVNVTKTGEVNIDIDFFEHDKVFKDKISELKQRIAELESKEMSGLPFDPLECANYLINATYERETNGIERAFHNLPEKVNSDRYTVGELEQLAEHLLIYCKHNKESEES